MTRRNIFELMQEKYDYNEEIRKINKLLNLCLGRNWFVIGMIYLQKSYLT